VIIIIIITVLVNDVTDNT